MQSETKYTKQDLETMRAWSLQRKIQVTQTRIIEWIGRYDWNVYISFSGGKDSTVLADLTARAYQAFWCPNRKEPLHLVFVNTGLEYPEIQKFVKYFAKWLERQYEIPVDLKVLTPELTFPEVLTKYGYPVIGKEVAKVIYYARNGSQWALNRLDGLDKCRARGAGAGRHAGDAESTGLQRRGMQRPTKKTSSFSTRLER